MLSSFSGLEVVFWDFDGVIKESVKVKTDAFYSLFRPHGEEIANKVKGHHLDHGGMSRFDKIPIYLAWAGIAATPETVREYCDKFASTVEDAVVQCAWVPGARKLLLERHEKLRFILVTATPQAEIESILERLDIRRCFARVYGAPTGKAAGIQTTLKELSIEPEKALMIGDSREDYLAAQRCGVPFVLRRTAENSKSMADYTGPSVDSFE